MALTIPTSMDDLLYFTNRADGDFKAKAWVKKKSCPKCDKALMGKPVNEKTGKVKIRSADYVCPACGHEEDKATHEADLEVEILYTCPECKKSGETKTPYKRKTFQGVPSYVFECVDCGHKMGLTKKLKGPKKKK